ncbi:DNA-directed RNA polymerase subunit F [Candidatus Micrarchaeota archaeon]|nr:DNA-directed RNA polymerase subunit F [Candidatus Micrarchaeota archaeon]
MKIISEKNVSLSEALSLLEKRQKDGDLGYEQQNTLNYLQEFVVLNEKDSNALEKELRELGVSEEQAVSLANLLPKKEDEVRAVLAGGKTTSPDLVKNILKAVKSYKPEKNDLKKTVE